MNDNVTSRTAYIDGLRQLADLLEEHPDAPLPYFGTAAVPLTVFARTGDSLAGYVEAFRGQVEAYRPDRPVYDYTLTGRLAGLTVDIAARTAEVCERAEVGTRQVAQPIVEYRTPLGDTLRPGDAEEVAS